MLILQGVSYTHPNRDLLFSDVSFTINKHEKIALIGNNGAGKSTLLRMMAGELPPSQGIIKTSARPYYVPQHFGQYNSYTIAQALGVEYKLNALEEILAGNVTDANMALLDDDWTIEERCREALSQWQLEGLDASSKISVLSGGQKTRVFLAGIAIHHPSVVLLDEPSNHLDAAGRNLLYKYIQSTNATLVAVSHDRVLLNLLTTVYELDRQGITVYGGNYDFYKEQKQVAADALNEDVKNREKELRKAKEVERETMERQQKLDARGRKKQEKSGLPTISLNTFRNNAEKSTAGTKDIHAGKIEGIANELMKLRKELPGKDKMKIGFDRSALRERKVLITAGAVNFAYHGKLLWNNPLNFVITSGERIAIKGPNGSGKTTLVKIIIGDLQPYAGTIKRAGFGAIYIDQDYSLIGNELSVYWQAQQFNTGKLDEHEVKSRLTHFLFTKEHWDKPCGVLSGGERMRLILCCLTLDKHSPDIIVLDEPTNNLDIQNAEILTAAVNEYRGTVIVISHDECFLEQIQVKRVIALKR